MQASSFERELPSIQQDSFRLVHVHASSYRSHLYLVALQVHDTALSTHTKNGLVSMLVVCPVLLIKAHVPPFSSRCDIIAPAHRPDSSALLRRRAQSQGSCTSMPVGPSGQ